MLRKCRRYIPNDIDDIIIFAPVYLLYDTFFAPFSKIYVAYGDTPQAIYMDFEEHIRSSPAGSTASNLQVLAIQVLGSQRTVQGKDAGRKFAMWVAIIFGGPHLLAWSSHFPSPVEMWLWRSSSLALVAPAVVLMVSGLIGPRIHGSLPKAIAKILSILTFFFIFYSSGLYIIARLILFVLPLIALRSVPCGAYKDINWLRIFPHFSSA
ncbi:hypothetical protein BJ165DRAFT_1535698 [Panaeolus papilionaceus]|nr:hypothetical protein BJ165DRAFT_1535698 [Panaeolus papilionaceus]